MENKNNKTGLIVLVIILSIMVVGLASYIIYDKIINPKENTSENKDNNIENDDNTIQNENENNNNIKPYSPKKHEIELTEKNHNISLNNDTLNLNFTGKKDEYNKLQYNLEITINNTKIKDNLFTKDELYIWEYDYAALFTVYETNKYYFFTSFIAKQFDGKWILITDKLGNIINEFYDVSFKFLDEKSFIITDCKTNDIQQKCEEKTYTIENNIITEK